MTEVEKFTGQMLRVRQGDHEAMSEILSEYGEAIQREVRFTLLDARLRRFVSDSDVFQSVVCRFYSGMQNGSFTISEPADLVRLVKGIARTRIAELVRFWHAKKRDLSRAINIDNDALEIASKLISPDESLARAELVAAVQNRLNANDSKILEFRDEGLSWDEIASRLNAISGEAIRKQHSRSISRIADELNSCD